MRIRIPALILLDSFSAGGSPDAGEAPADADEPEHDPLELDRPT